MDGTRTQETNALRKERHALSVNKRPPTLPISGGEVMKGNTGDGKEQQAECAADARNQEHDNDHEHKLHDSGQYAP
jgi:hypothetical protein